MCVCVCGTSLNSGSESWGGGHKHIFALHSEKCGGGTCPPPVPTPVPMLNSGVRAETATCISGADIECLCWGHMVCMCFRETTDVRHRMAPPVPGQAPLTSMLQHLRDIPHRNGLLTLGHFFL